MSDKAALRGYLEMLRGTWAAVEAGVKAGKTLEQLKAEPVLGPWDKFSWAFISRDFFTETLYTEMTKK